jgi:hypothetical protein
MIIVTRFMPATDTLGERVTAHVLGRHAKKMSATVAWKSTLHSGQNHRRALGKLLQRLQNNGDVKGQHDCVQAEVLDGTRYWAVQVLPSTHRTVEDLVNYFKELEC